MYTPTATGAAVTAGDPLRPEIGVGLPALNVHASGPVVAPVPPLSTVARKVRLGVRAVLAMVQITVASLVSVTVVSVSTPPWHTHSPASKPGGPASLSV